MCGQDIWITAFLFFLSAGLFFAFDLFFTNADKLNKLLQKLNCRQTIVDGCEIKSSETETYSNVIGWSNLSAGGLQMEL